MVLALAAVAAADPRRPTTAPGRPAAPDADTAPPLSRMLLDKPDVPLTPPTGAAPRKAPVVLPVEGSMVVDRQARLAYGGKDGWLVLRFPPETGRADEAPRRALPNQLLEQMEAQVARSPAVRFRVSGETTVYDGQAYLLLTKATVLPAAPAAAPEPSSKPAAPPPKGGSDRGAPKSRPAAGGEAEPTSDDILQELLKDKAGRPVVVPPGRPRPAPAPSVAPGAGKPLPADRGGMVVDRLVRIRPEPGGSWWAACFEADNTLQEPPIRVLPCGFLAKARRIAETRGIARERLLRISGLVTHYKQRRYILIRKLLIERRLGRF